MHACSAFIFECFTLALYQPEIKLFFCYRFCIGKKCTYVDLTLFHCLRATEAQWPEVWAQADYIPALKTFKERMAARPKMAAYLKSDRCRPFAGDSMM